MNKKQQTRLIIILVAAILIVDQVVKILVKTNMYITEDIPLIGSWCRLHFIENEGFAFGIHFGGVVGKVLLTLNFDSCGLMLPFVREANTSRSVIDVFDGLERTLGLEAFRELLPVVLTDNGTEFSNPAALETSPDTGERRTRIFYCRPYSAWQKPHVENNHLLVRRVMPKGVSFDGLRQEQVDRMVSHINSYQRASLDGKTPYDAFVSFYGEQGRGFLEKLNVRRINADCVTLDPSLLGPDFKREADNAILRKKGVIE